MTTSGTVGTTPPNAFFSITVHGLVSKNGASYPQTLNRGAVKPGLHASIEMVDYMRPGGIPLRPPSNLPPPGDQHLTLSLGERLGKGRVGSVHDVTVIGTAVQLPRLVAKVSQRKKSGSMAQEAWFYEELEQLQGVSIPQCYGFFQTRLPGSYRVSIWGSDSDESEDEDKNELKIGGGYEDEVKYDGPVVNEKKYERELPGQGRVLSILVLEKLGGNIPVGKPLDPSIKDDICELFNDMARLGIEPMDIRWSNILSANDDLETNSSGKTCPNHGHVHRWRLVDFDLCRKSDVILRLIDGWNNEWLNKLFDNLVKGGILEPWD